MSEITLLVELLKQHAEEDSRRFEEVNQKLDKIVANQESLMESRALAHGAWKTIAIVASLASFAMSALFTVGGWFLKVK